jgi:AmmeMemoRadiSam system protein B
MAKEKTRGIRKRAPVVNGIFYPDNAEIISSTLTSWGLKKYRDPSPLEGQIILAPHGAWDLTGNIAAAAFKAAAEKNSGDHIARVLLLGARHSPGEDGIFLSESVFYSTPLGNLRVDSKMNQKLSSCSTLAVINDIPHLAEHSLEVLLPFVKFCFPGAKIVPILIGGAKPALVSALARMLKISLEKRLKETLIVVSSNVSSNIDPVLALSMAEEFSALLEKAETEAYITKFAEGRLSACGAAPMGALLESGLLGGGNFTRLSPLVKGMGENGETIYYGAFATGRAGSKAGGIAAFG